MKLPSLIEITVVIDLLIDYRRLIEDALECNQFLLCESPVVCYDFVAVIYRLTAPSHDVHKVDSSPRGARRAEWISFRKC